MICTHSRQVLVYSPAADLLLLQMTLLQSLDACSMHALLIKVAGTKSPPIDQILPHCNQYFEVYAQLSPEALLAIRTVAAFGAERKETARFEEQR